MEQTYLNRLKAELANKSEEEKLKMFINQCRVFFEESRIMSERLSLKKLLDMYNYVDELIKSLENNPNYTLLCTVLCAGI